MYKFNGVKVNMGHLLTNIDRQTYSLLDWLGDVGGLYDGLHLLIHYFVVPLGAYALKVELLTSTFNTNSLREGELLSNDLVSYMAGFLCCQDRHRRYRRLLDKASVKID